MRAGILVAGSIAVAASAVAFAGEAQGIDPGRDSIGVVATEPATLAALRAFELRVDAVHASQLARAETNDSDAASEEAPSPSDTPRLRLRGVLDRMSLSTSWQVEQDSWRAGIRLRFSRSVEFDPTTHSYAVLEAIEITPAVRFRIVSLALLIGYKGRRTSAPNHSAVVATDAPFG